MKQPTKQQQKDKAEKAYHAIFKLASEAYQAIKDPAYKAYQAKLKEINAQHDKPTPTLQDLMKKHCIEHGYENDQSNLDGFIAEVTKLMGENK